MEKYLKITNATKYYKKFKAVDNVNLTINKNEFFTILGPSGSGKTSLLKIIAGFERISSGSILLNNRDISLQKVYKRNIGMVFQNYALFPNMTVFENVAYPLRIRKRPKKEVEKIVSDTLRMVQLEELRTRYPNELSGGQQQRVALARAVVFNPALLLLDEPLSALDKRLRERMQIEIKHIQQKSGITTISVTHDQKEALTMSDRICVMREGRIEQVDTPHNLYRFPRNRFVAEFIGEINLISGELIEIRKDTAFLRLEKGETVSVQTQGIIEYNHQDYLVAVRPENIRIAREKGDFQNYFKAKTIEMIYIGEAIMARMETSTGISLKVNVPSVQSDLIGIGRTLFIGWNAQDATLIQEESENMNDEAYKVGELI